MSLISEFLDKLLGREEIIEMVNLRPRFTGLTKLLYISQEKASHGPRVKLSPLADKFVKGQSVSISIAAQPQVLTKIPKGISSSDIELAKRWIILNREALLQIWNWEIVDPDEI